MFKISCLKQKCSFLLKELTLLYSSSRDAVLFLKREKNKPSDFHHRVKLGPGPVLFLQVKARNAALPTPAWINWYASMELLCWSTNLRDLINPPLDRDTSKHAKRTIKALQEGKVRQNNWHLISKWEKLNSPNGGPGRVFISQHLKKHVNPTFNPSQDGDMSNLRRAFFDSLFDFGATPPESPAVRTNRTPKKEKVSVFCRWNDFLPSQRLCESQHASLLFISKVSVWKAADH